VIFSFNSTSVLQLQSDTSSVHVNFAIDFCKDWLNGKQHFVFHTSGSTGTPKKIELTRDQLEASANATIHALNLTSNEKIFICLNTQLIAGAMMLVRGMLLNCELFLIEPTSEPLKYLDENHEMTFASFVPMQLHNLLNDDLVSEQKLNQFKDILIGGTSINSSLGKKLSQLKTNIFQTYGMTETVSHIALKKVGSENYFSVLSNIEIKKDERDCLCIKGKVTNNKWIITNDLVELIDSTHFNLLGRVDDIINSGGIKIFPQKVEHAIHEAISILNLGVKEFFVASQKDNLLGEKLISIFCCKQFSVDEEKKLDEYLRQHLSSFEIPKAFYFVHSFERTDSGKIDKIKTLRILFG
jgi:o-succinylbenzoate---CoA ligase